MGKQRSNTEDFIRKAQMKHGAKYEYSLVNYQNAITKVSIVCPQHGVFEQTPNIHLNGGGCYWCGRDKTLSTTRKNKYIFIEQANLVHNFIYDYSNIIYVNTDTDVLITCPQHGEFAQRPDHHLKGRGCPRCGKTGHYSQRQFIERVTFLHDGKYDYSDTKYINGDSYISYICPQHGAVQQKAKQHLVGRGCPLCRESKGESKIAFFLEEHEIDYIRNKKFKGCAYKKPLSFDFYLPEYNLCIEYDGPHHFAPIPYWDGERAFRDVIIRDQIKNDFCRDGHIGLLRIRFDDDLYYYLNQLL